MALPVNVRDLMNIGNQLQTERERMLGIAVVVEADAPDPLLIELEAALKPRTARVDVTVSVAGAESVRLKNSTDAVIVLLGSGSLDVQAVIAEARERAMPVVTLALTGVTSATAAMLHVPLDDFLEDDDAAHLVRVELAERLSDHLQNKRLALAANFDFMRAAVAGEYVRATSWQNALIGGVTIIPGADMPLMTGNQAKMVLQIAAAYGQKLDSERARELAAVVGGGFALRAVARQLLDFIPGFGWALKAGVGYSGTLAMGRAAIAYFEQGADVSTLVARLEAGALGVTEKVLPRIERPRRRLMPRRLRSLRSKSAEETAPYAEAASETVPGVPAALQPPAGPAGALHAPDGPAAQLEPPVSPSPDDEGAGA
jgi:uncharacterized protein (DUF697 family)